MRRIGEVVELAPVFRADALAAFRRWRDTVALQNVSDRLIGELMAEIGESAGNAIVTPAFVLL